MCQRHIPIKAIDMFPPILCQSAGAGQARIEPFSLNPLNHNTTYHQRGRVPDAYASTTCRHRVTWFLEWKARCRRVCSRHSISSSDTPSAIHSCSCCIFLRRLQNWRASIWNICKFSIVSSLIASRSTILYIITQLEVCQEAANMARITIVSIISATLFLTTVLCRPLDLPNDLLPEHSSQSASPPTDSRE
jgi:hypothetical protein